MKTDVRDIIVTQVAKELQEPEEVVDKVLVHQYKNIFTKAIHECREIEVSGFGTFSISKGKLERRLAKLTQIEQALINKMKNETSESLARKLENVTKDIGFYHQKL